MTLTNQLLCCALLFATFEKKIFFLIQFLIVIQLKMMTENAEKDSKLTPEKWGNEFLLIASPLEF